LRLLAVAVLVLAAAGCPQKPSAPCPDAAADAADAVSPGDAWEPDPKKTLLVLLGTGTPNADPDRSGPASAVVVGGRAYIVDCGPGVVRRASAAFLKGVKALAPENLTRAFITHLHSDHTAGYPDLILTPWTLGRREPLQVFGPTGLKSMTDHIVAAYGEDMDVRLTGKEPADEAGFVVQAAEVMPGVVYRDEHVTVTAFKVEHGAWRHAYGYKFETGDRTIVISGDTTRTESIVEQCNGCDILLHEVYSTWGFSQRPASWQAYHKSAHTSSAELADVASRANPGLLVLTHQLLWGATPDQLLAEIRQGYGGKVAFGNDLDIF